MTEELRLRVKNWSEFQHYKNRNPTWIKLHKKILDDYDFYSLPLASRALAPMLWLLASESMTGEIVGSWNKLAFRLHTASADLGEVLKPLVDKAFIECLHDASGLLAPRNQDACLEKRREETYKQEEEGEQSAPDNLDELSEEIGHEHPAAAHLKNKFLPENWKFAICEAVMRDGKDAVIAGTRNYRDAVSEWPPGERRFIVNPVRFYGSEAMYLDDPAKWRTYDRKQSKRDADEEIMRRTAESVCTDPA